MIIGNNVVFRRATKLEATSGECASVLGTTKKTIALLAVTMVSALLAMFVIGILKVLTSYIFIAVITFILCIIICLKPRMARYLAIPYAILEGLTAGAITGIAALAFPEYGLSIGAIAFIATIAIFLVAAVLYLSGTIRVTSKFRRIMYVALLGTLVFSAIIFISSLFIPGLEALFYGANFSLSLIISIVMVLFSAIYVVISLDNAMTIVESGLDKEYEWYAGFGILVNILWLYYEILRLLIRIAARSNRN